VTAVAYTLGQAAKAADVSKTTIQRAIKSGRLSASRQEDGSYVIDPAELHRAFPRDGNADPEMKQSVTLSEPGELRVEVEMLRERISEKDEVIDDLRRRLDQSQEERRQVQARLTGLLTDQRPQPAARRGWWRRLRGK
jgi:Helix-turn-helix domain